MDATNVTVGLIGAGYWGRNLARCFHQLGVLHTICDPAPHLLAGYREQYPGVRLMPDAATVWDDPSITAVAIAAPAALHFELARRALEAGKDVFVEKPLCLRLDEGRQLIELAAARNRILMVGHLLQYHPCIQKLRELVRDGVLGRLHYITSNRLNLGKFRREENALWSFAPHDLSVILALAGHRLPCRVRCTGESYLNHGVADTTLTTLRFDQHLCAHVYVSWLNPFKEQKLTVVGSDGMAVFDDTRPWPEKLILYRQYLKWADGQVPTPSRSAGELVPVTEGEPLALECRHFLECCRRRQPPLTDGHEGLRVLSVLDAAQRSLDRDGEATEPRPVTGPDAGGAAPPAVAAAGAVAPVAGSNGVFIHPTAVVDPGAQIGSGTRIWHFTHVCAGARIGNNCVLGQNCFVADGVVLGNNVKVQNNVSLYTGVVVEDDVFLGPSCVLTNVTNPRAQVNRHALYEKTVIRRGATVGANATIVCGVTIGRYAFIAAGAVVTRDVPDYALMVGVPARQRGWMSRHGHPLPTPDAEGVMRCPETGFRYREVAPGRLQCLDLDEEAPLPPDLRAGRRPYREFNP
ncbi:Gfo/Idh/MocA family oxidoreductase [Limisphaera ngatamarikiensis]|uniref:Gfo/Idh/MocA family oxidoreductase n=1 Tax=Limisphaera ngatamarikiensis TaxID=1324935 RepID=A0A6M1RU67_9BACT|nr:Gfo/Idh/MocA family oxidoreductase [Limisphaera ngatamarikiensis]NGO40185.1 Gfo/Idh/MocA family oxidoreductase [Limisphaera ngatamarikiensis]